jgi:hypothetical protein
MYVALLKMNCKAAMSTGQFKQNNLAIFVLAICKHNNSAQQTWSLLQFPSEIH